MAVTVRVPILFHRPLAFGAGAPIVALVETPPPAPAAPAEPHDCVGPQGPTGPQGNQGRQGFVGAKGVQGDIGFNGEVGPQGMPGVQGPIGFQGVAGATGENGFQGPAGFQGAAGVQGPQGRQGVAGSAGVQGPQGRQGVAGSAGAQGRQGFQGSGGSFLEVPTPIEADPDQQMPMGSGGSFQSIQNTFQSTQSPPGVMTVSIATAGNYVLFWYAEVARGSAGGGNRIMARVRHTNQASTTVTLANFRRINNLQNSSGAIPLDEIPAQQAADGDLFPWSGFDRLNLAVGTHTFRLEYAADAIGNNPSQDVLHTRRQKLMLLRTS